MSGNLDNERHFTLEVSVVTSSQTPTGPGRRSLNDTHDRSLQRANVPGYPLDVLVLDPYGPLRPSGITNSWRSLPES